MRLPEAEGSTAILIGTAVYRDQALPNILPVSNNVADLAGILTEPATGGFLPKNVHSMVNPTHTEVGRRLARLCRQADDVLLVYFAGHGLIDDNGELLLAVTDTEEDVPGYTSLSVGQLRRGIADSPAGIRILILDCCYSGRALPFMSAPESALMGQIELKGTYALASAPRDTLSMFVEGARHTVFSGELISLLREGVEDDQPLLSLGTVHRQLLRRLRLGNYPTPKVLHGDTASDLALVRNNGYRPGRVEPKPEPEPPRRLRSPADVDEFVRARPDQLHAAATDSGWPILARLRFACALVERGRHDTAIIALRSLESPNPGSAISSISALLYSLHRDERWTAQAGDRWDLDGLLEPTAVWGIAMAMLLDAAKLPIPVQTQAIAELAELGYPEQSAYIAQGMLRDTTLVEPVKSRFRELAVERQ